LKKRLQNHTKIYIEDNNFDESQIKDMINIINESLITLGKIDNFKG